MKYAVDSKEMKLIDVYTRNIIKIPEAVLMERAAYEVAAVMKEQINKSDRILAVCGPGNNGGDGVATGRILYLQGYHVAILFIGEEEKASHGMKEQLEIARNLGIGFENYNKLTEYNIIIDSIFGVGLSRPVTGIYEEIIREINSQSNIVYSVDVPSGISADSGKILNAAVRADYTVTFGYNKLGLLFYPGADYAGIIKVVDIGFPESVIRKINPASFYYEPEDLNMLPRRVNYSNKGTYGKVLVIAGSKGMSGAAYLSAKAAYRSGVGLVKVLTSKENRCILQTSLPEALFAAYDEEIIKEEAEKTFLRNLSWANVILIGPGIGQTKTSLDLLKEVLKHSKVPVIIDADAITLLSEMADDYCRNVSHPKIELSMKQLSETDYFASTKQKIFDRLSYIQSLTESQLILTPHLMELSRLLTIPVSEIVNNLIDTACQCSYNNMICTLKDARSIVVQNKKRYINVTGNHGMATGGSGDVLAGIIAGMIAQGMMPYEAVCLSVYIHGLAGDAAAKEHGTYSMMAGDIITSIEKVLP